MSSPRHLWSGDWERDSASLEEDLATRERLPYVPDVADPEVAEAPERVRMGDRLAPARHGLRGALAAVAAGLRRISPRALALAAIVAVLVVAGALAINSLVGGGSSNGTKTEASLRAADALFGVQLSTPPNHGVVIETVTAGGPAELAGLDPGDTLTAIDNRPISDANSVAAAIKDLHGGGQAVLQVSRGSAIITTLLTLTGHP
jgi:membrane-associated protease RseP (regulator of RpoE activity)